MYLILKKLNISISLTPIHTQSYRLSKKQMKMLSEQI